MSNVTKYKCHSVGHIHHIIIIRIMVQVLSVVMLEFFARRHDFMIILILNSNRSCISS